MMEKIKIKTVINNITSYHDRTELIKIFSDNGYPCVVDKTQDNIWSPTKIKIIVYEREIK